LISSVIINLNGAPITPADSIFVYDDLIKIGFSKTYDYASESIGDLSLDGNISNVISFNNADFDVLGVNSITGQIYGIDGVTDLLKIFKVNIDELTITENFSFTFEKLRGNDVEFIDSTMFLLNNVDKKLHKINLDNPTVVIEDISLTCSLNDTYCGLALKAGIKEADSSFIEELWIDTIDSTVKSGSQILESDVTYLITIEGTHSYYIVSKYEEWIGTPEARPIFYDGEIQYCYVGADAGYKFSCIGEYGYTVESLPILTPNIKFSFDSGITWYNNYIKQYNSNHIYQFVYKGKGFPLKIKFHDNYYSDNYGKYKIIIKKENHQDDFPNICENSYYLPLNQEIIAKIDYAGLNENDGDCDYFKIEIPEQMSVSIYTSGDTDTYGVLFNCCKGSPPDCSIRIEDSNSGENNNFRINK